MRISKINEHTLTISQMDRLLFEGIAYPGIKAGTALILGTNYDAKGRAEGAAALYKEGGVKKLIPTGGVEWDFEGTRRSEAAYMKEVMVRNGVSLEDVLLEEKATDTLENMTYSRAILQKDPSLTEDGKLIIITSAYHMQRSLLLAKKVFPDLTIIPYPIYEPDVTPGSWMNYERGLSRVKNDVHFLIKHAKEGLITDEDFPGI